MQFITAQQELAAQLGEDYTNSDTATMLKRWLNLSYKDIAGFWRWSWLKDRESVSTEVDYTTGTVSVTASSTLLTFSGSITASQENRYIQFSSANDWYKITTHTAGDNNALITPAYIQTSNLTSGTFTIRTFYYSTSSSVDYIVSAKEAINPRPIAIMSPDILDNYHPFTDSQGTPQAIIIWGQDSSGNWQFTPHPMPDAKILIELRTVKKITELSDSTDEPLFPTRFDSIWLDGAKAYGHEFLDDDRSSSVFKRFYLKLDNMKSQDEVGLSKFRVLKPVDRPSGRRSTIPYPAEFGDV